MNRQQAQNIIRETFENPFEKQQFTIFIRDLLNHFDEDTFVHRGYVIPDSYDKYIRSWQRMGKYFDGEKRIDILIVNLRKATSLERARSMQRNFVAGYLQGKYGRSSEKDAALVAYVSPDKTDWRFSLVKLEYKFDENGKVKEEFTPARRWSFLVGSNEASHTAQSRLVPILADDKHNPTLARLEEAFNIERVTKEFFLEYRNLFIRTKEELDKVVASDRAVQTDFQAKGVDTVNFTKKLMGQIVFLYFLQKKGWFGVERDADWGDGSKRFLRELFEKKHGDYANFFNDILEPLFYDALSRDRSDIDHWNDQFKCKIPFLNGGLFDPIGNYSWYKTDILLPNDLFSNNLKTKSGDSGNGILDIFDRYNFTVKEDEPLEREVAIDPELLGKAYEKFNAIRPDNFAEYKAALKSGQKGAENKFNKKFGVYYTPREIVHYMCKQSLINYLHTKVTQSSLSGDIKKITKQDIEDIIEVGEIISEYEAMALIKQKNIENGIQKSSEYTLLLSDNIRENAEIIDNWLAEITVCDPAVGSGAFPVGMMHEIVKIREVLSVYIDNKGLQPLVVTTESDRTIYHFKRECIEKSLYGVDIDPGAVEIAKLRLWLSLVVDETDIKNIKPLPNLDYKIVCGNSLLSVEKNLFNDPLFKQLERLKPQYFNETNPTKKQEYKKQIDDLIGQITNGHTEFDFEVYFSEVFHDRVIEKDWSLYHITWVTHNSRISERMIENEAIIHQKRINKGLPPIAEPTVLNDKQEILVTKSIGEIVRENKFRVLAYNICRDHVHLALVCEEKDRDNIVRKLKGKSAQKYKEAYKIEAEFHLWAQKYGWTLIESEEQLENTANYIKYNRRKHGLPDHKGLQPLVAKMLIPFDKAMQPVVEKGGFDVVIANPPYGAELKKSDVNYLVNKYKYFDRQKNSASFFLELAANLCREINGSVTYIVPKSLSFSEGWKNTRQLVSGKNQLSAIVDVSKAFEEVLLEQIIVSFLAKNTVADYSFLVGEGWKGTVNIFSNVNSSLIKQLDIFPVYVDSLKQNIYLKMKHNSVSLSEISDTFRGLPVQKFISKKGQPILRGKNIGKYSIYGKIDKVLLDTSNDKKINRILQPKIVSQNIVAHVTSPFDRIIIMATIDTTPYLTFDTVMNTIINDKQFDMKYILAVLNSALASWFYYWFVYNRAIRTMHFDKYYIGKLPMKIISGIDQKPFIELVDKILSLNRADTYLQNPQNKVKVKALEQEIDRMVYKLYGLTEEEIRIVEGEG